MGTIHDVTREGDDNDEDTCRGEVIYCNDHTTKGGAVCIEPSKEGAMLLKMKLNLPKRGT